jgi:surface protein
MRRLIHGMRSGVDTASFIFTVKTDNTGTSASNQFTIPTQVVLGFPYNYNVKTSDGQTINGNTGNLTITFPSAGTYDISIKGLFPKIYFNNTGDRLKLLEVKQWGTNIIWHNLVNGFWGCANAIFDNILDVPTFNSTIAARSIMGNIFRDCGSLSTVGRLNDWDLSLNTSLERPFGGSTSKPFNQNIGNWDVSKVVNFTRCFEGCPNFNNGGNSSINNWTLNTSANVTFDAMFINCVSFNQPIGNWNTSRVVNTNSMFNNCQIFNQDLSNWNLGNNINMGNMFIGCTQFNNGGSNGIKDWDVKNVTTMSGVFLNCTNFNQPLTNWDTTKVTTTLQMFQSCVNFNQDLSTWNTANVTNMGAMFRFARAFNQNLGNWNVTKVSSFNFMFNTNNANPMVFNNGGSPDINKWLVCSLDHHLINQ